MATIKYFSLIFLFTVISNVSYSEERQGKAVFETSPEQGMKLTAAALKNIEIKTVKINAGSEHSVPIESLVRFQNEVGIYRLRENWYKLIKIQVVKKGPKDSIIRSSDLGAGDQLVIHGADLLRVSELDAFGSGE